jgi:plastocyanin
LTFLAFAALVAAALVATAATAAHARARAPMRVTVDIVSAGHDEIALPANLAIRAGGTTTIVFRNHTRAFHTFTIRALGVSVLVRPANRNGVRSTSVSFVAPYGTYEWRCVICGTAVHGHMHAMRGMVYAIVNV